MSESSKQALFLDSLKPILIGNGDVRSFIIEDQRQLLLNRGWREMLAPSFSDIDGESAGTWAVIASNGRGRYDKENFRACFEDLAICQLIPENISKVACLSLWDLKLDGISPMDISESGIVVLYDRNGFFTEGSYRSAFHDNGIKRFTYMSDQHFSSLVASPETLEYAKSFSEEELAGFRWRFAAYECWKAATCTRSNIWPRGSSYEELGAFAAQQAPLWSCGVLEAPAEIQHPPGGWKTTQLDYLGAFDHDSTDFLRANEFVCQFGRSIATWEDMLADAGCGFVSGKTSFSEIACLIEPFGMEKRIRENLSTPVSLDEWPHEQREAPDNSSFRHLSEYHGRVVHDIENVQDIGAEPGFSERKLTSFLQSDEASAFGRVDVIYPGSGYNAFAIHYLPSPETECRSSLGVGQVAAMLLGTHSLSAPIISSRRTPVGIIPVVLGVIPSNVSAVVMVMLEDTSIGSRQADGFRNICDRHEWELILDEGVSECSGIDLLLDSKTTVTDLRKAYPSFREDVYEEILPAARVVEASSRIAFHSPSLSSYVKELPFSLGTLGKLLSFGKHDGYDEAFGDFPEEFNFSYGKNPLAQLLGRRGGILSGNAKKSVDEICDLWRIWQEALSERHIAMRQGLVPEQEALWTMGGAFGIDHAVDAYFSGVPIEDLLLE